MTIDGQPCAAAGMLPEIPEGTQPFSGEVQAAGVLLDPATGQVLALLGDTSPDGRGERINGHQPGSMLTPFVAVAAFARGLNPANLVWDVPASQPAELEAFSAADYDYHGPVRLRSALASDYMTPISQLLMQVGPETVWRLAEPLGLNLLIGEDQPEALLYRGGYITPVELAQAYAVFANQGLQVGQRAADGRIRPALYIYITDTAGKTVAPGEQPARAPVLSAQLAYLTHHVLSESGAVPQAAAESALGRPAALKTGQAQFGREVWAAGYTPQRLGVVWLGLADDGPESLAPEFAAGLWQAVMAYAGRGLPVESAWPAAPDGITMLQVCEPSGKLPTPYCPLTVEEVFAAGSEPLESDDLYRPVQINRETGRLATVFTPFDLVVEDVYLYLPAEAGDWRPDGLKLPPEQYDALQAMTFTPGLNTAAQAGVSIGQPANLSYVRGQTAVYGSASGEEFEAYRLEVGQGLNPERWYLLKEAAGVEIGDGLLGVWDTRQYADGLYALSLVAQYADQQAALTAVLVTVDNTLPQARLLYPEDGQTLQLDAGETINLQAEVTDEIGIERVEWVMDGVVLGETRNAPHTQEWQASAGPHKLWLRAFDLAGNMGQSQPVMFEFSQP
jgi:membrane carboxypeptidase/penicillin-binding protein PbpC